MKSFVCSLCHNGILGGGLYLDSQSLTYKTNKLTVDKKYRDLVMPLQEIKEISSADEIAYLNNSGNVCYTKNFKKVWSGKKDVFEIELENGKKIRATEEHLFFTNNGLKALKDLTEKDELIEIN